MKTKITDVRERLCNGADLVIDFATLGEYGYQAPPTARPARRSRGSRTSLECLPAAPCDAGGRVHDGTTALQRRAARLERFAS